MDRRIAVGDLAPGAVEVRAVRGALERLAARARHVGALHAELVDYLALEDLLVRALVNLLEDVTEQQVVAAAVLHALARLEFLAARGDDLEHLRLRARRGAPL